MRRSTLTIVAILLAIPLITLLVAAGVQWKLSSDIRQEMIQQFPERADAISSAAASNTCEVDGIRANKELGDLCGLNDKLGLMQSGAVAAGVAGILLLVFIRIAGRLSRKSRTLLLILFGPGLYLSMLVMGGLTIVYAVLGTAVIYYGESILAGRVHPGMILAFGIGAIYGVFALLRAQWSALQKASTGVVGKRLDRQQYGRLWRFVDDLANEMCAQPPEAIIAGLQPNFYVTEADVEYLDGELRGRTMYISLPLCRILGTDEFKAVVGHELAHYKGADTSFSSRFYPIYRGASQGLANLASNFSGRVSASDIIVLPAFTMLAYFLNAFSSAESEISRQRELAADSQAAEIVSARSIATALVKVYAYSVLWQVVRVCMQDAIENGKMMTNASVFFAGMTSEVEAENGLEEISQEGPSHPTDTHPPLSARLQNLSVAFAEISTDAENTSPQPAAIDLVEGAESLEIELSEIEQAMMIQSGEARPGEPSEESQT